MQARQDLHGDSASVEKFLQPQQELQEVSQVNDVADLGRKSAMPGELSRQVLLRKQGLLPQGLIHFII